MSDEYVGVDIGGQSIKAGRVIDGKIKKFTSVPTEAGKGQKTVLDNIAKAIKEVLTKKTKAIGIGCPGGHIDIKKGIVHSTANLPFKNINLTAYFSRKFRLPVRLDNDARAFAFGEALYGAGKGYMSILGVTLGTGLGGGIVIDKKIEHGRGNAGEMGHMKLVYNGRKCHCKRIGCLEAYVSSYGIIETAKEFRLKIKSPKELYDLASGGNPKAIKAWQETGKYLGVGIANALNLLDPDVVVIGGNISKAWRFFSRTMIEIARDESLSGSPKIARAKLEHAGVVGAAALFNKS